MDSQKPVVSAVIPTRNRPELVCRAVRSVLSQTIRDLECVVVIDGPDEATERALSEIADPRLRILPLQENVGGCEARNLGGQSARGEWVALLDDDDEWLPYRLEKQLAAVAQAAGPVTMVVSRFVDRGISDQDQLIRPHIFPAPGQPISEFLWCEVSPLGGIAGFPQTSTWLLRRDFLLEVPFTRGLKMLQDLDWLLHGYHHTEMRVLFVDEPLTIFHNDHARGRVAKRTDWQHSVQWAMGNRHLFTRRAFGFFLVVDCINRAAQQGVPWTEIISLFKSVRRYGTITPKLMQLCFLYVFVYPWIAKLLTPRRRATMLYRLRGLVRRATGVHPAEWVSSAG
jgi:glycosyltransferase involved in cell wall biosynthesis